MPGSRKCKCKKSVLKEFDNHTLCFLCRSRSEGSCTPQSPCTQCKDWDEAKWKQYLKYLAARISHFEQKADYATEENVLKCEMAIDTSDLIRRHFGINKPADTGPEKEVKKYRAVHPFPIKQEKQPVAGPVPDPDPPGVLVVNILSSDEEKEAARAQAQAPPPKKMKLITPTSEYLELQKAQMATTSPAQPSPGPSGFVAPRGPAPPAAAGGRANLVDSMNTLAAQVLELSRCQQTMNRKLDLLLDNAGLEYFSEGEGDHSPPHPQ